MQDSLSFPAKLLLFGEYTVLSGSAALTLPLPHFSGYWDRQQQVDAALMSFADFLQGEDLPLYTDRFRKELGEGLFFNSNIPSGYGVGSSGALCAGVWSRYGVQDAVELAAAKDHLARMEHFFHGASSGLDPLTSWVDAPVLKKGDSLETVQFSIPENLFLLDSRKARQTAPLVQYFQQQMQEESFKGMLEQALSPAVDASVQALLSNDHEELMRSWRQISELQLQHFSPMIPNILLPDWHKGLLSGQWYLKLCGAGGGGYFLGWSVQDQAPNGAWFPFR